MRRGLSNTDLANENARAHRRHLQEIRNYLKRAGGWQRLRKPDYVLRLPKAAQPDEVYCKICGAKIQFLTPHPDHQDRLVLTCGSSYREIALEFDNGSAHITPICSDCLRGNLDRTTLLELYYADSIQFSVEEGAGLGEAPWYLIADRKPKGVGQEWQAHTLTRRGQQGRY
jgi:hypothetical protein